MKRNRTASLLLRALGALLAVLLSVSCGVIEYLPVPTVETLDVPGVPATADPIASPDREVRGVWIASVYNINYPSRAGLDAAALAKELDDIVATCLACNLNTINFQVRPSGDALYKSEIFPTSVYLSGKEGEPADGDFDPLAYLCRAAHAVGIDVNAWVNPLRATVGSAAAPATDPAALSASNPARLHPEYVVPYADGRLYYNPGLPEVRALIADGVREIVANYPVDGIVFDDYFYPYAAYTEVDGKQVIAKFDDSAAYAQYGEGADREDWRRENVNKMIRACYDAVKETDESCTFGVAPFGIWKNNDGTNGGSDTAGLESYYAIECDPLAWIAGGYIDYIAPQIYWCFSTSVAHYDVLVRWWNAQVQGTGVDLIISHGDYLYEDMEDPDDEILRQIEFARAEVNYKGSFHYGYASIAANTNGVADELKRAYGRTVLCADAQETGADFLVSAPQAGTWVDSETSYVIGSCDPTATVYFDGKKVSITKNGCFSVQATLALGENVLRFTVDGKEYCHTLYRYLPNSGPVTLDGFVIDTVSPAASAIARAGDELTLTAVAPSGATVTATVGGKTVTLEPTVFPEGSSAYLAETYCGTVVFDGTEPLLTVGEIVFSAVRGSEHAEKTGAVLSLLGEGYGLPVTVTRDYALLKTAPDSSFYDDYTPQLLGAVSTAVGERDGYYLLTMGGWMSADDLTLEPPSREARTGVLRQMLQTRIGNDAVFYLKTREKPLVSGALDGSTFTLTVFDVTISDAEITRELGSPLISGVALEEKDGCGVITLTLTDPTHFYGFTVEYTVAEGIPLLCLTLKAPTALATGDNPLAGKRILLDAGHGGDDPGALGAFGVDSGKNEKDVNLAVVLAMRDKLEALGATVILSRESDVTIELEEREAFFLETNPDLAVVIHQNSMPFATNISRVRGIAAFYCADSGQLLAAALSDEMSAALGRDAYEPGWLTLMLCRNHRFVSALVETGFMTSVEEYDRMLRAEGIDTTAEGAVNGILEFFRRAAADYN